ncbi:MAG: hypothetical protein B7Y50_03315 [Hydrogenophilales bacterium 28-61-11]|nr:MAG: hypothetical protein B7Y50_03315 [Hydrogenophilales bacterium 28-61-11]OYZ57252.1 MAG: hypothetical protein B7Y21_08240 [Hydrogenophilales bacterium 16-61-112]OZA50988.1 MAG: hypothetical protein B7X81_00810 [Hydrogenophilales bacterium 17-61-76]
MRGVAGRLERRCRNPAYLAPVSRTGLSGLACLRQEPVLCRALFPFRGYRLRPRKRGRPASLQASTRAGHDLVVVASQADGDSIVGSAHYVIQPVRTGCEFVIVVADRWSHHGIGHQLMRALFACAKSQGIARRFGRVLGSNRDMIHVCTGMGIRGERQSRRLVAEDCQHDALAYRLNGGWRDMPRAYVPGFAGPRMHPPPGWLQTCLFPDAGLTLQGERVQVFSRAKTDAAGCGDLDLAVPKNAGTLLDFADGLDDVERAGRACFINSLHAGDLGLVVVRDEHVAQIEQRGMGEDAAHVLFIAGQDFSDQRTAVGENLAAVRRPDQADADLSNLLGLRHVQRRDAAIDGYMGEPGCALHGSQGRQRQQGKGRQGEYGAFQHLGVAPHYG